MSSTTALDVIDHLTGSVPADRIDLIRSLRPATRRHAQEAYETLFAPNPLPETFPIVERLAVAAFVGSLHGDPALAQFYADELAARSAREGGEQSALVKAVGEEAERGRTTGPYGAYPAGPLSREDRSGLHYVVRDDARVILGEALSTGLEHAHLLVFHPRDAEAAGAQALFDAGWTPTAVVTLSQLVAFLSFQIRVVAGLRRLSGAASPQGA